ncbi:hypothetical protein FSP39_006097 [Pinctada imbricata]|uniref:Malonyl-CoA decarboxylase n=1 Tax=Pinctada imbricata TaxID=66713 RepID=A0AA88YHM0_PINIB|nr:hypothetical protein FSP39_006097 [Pinctada imbricata]
MPTSASFEIWKWIFPGLELVGPSKRVFTGIVIEIMWCVSELILAALAYWLKNWRYLQISFTVIYGLFLPYWYFLPESSRWLISVGKSEKARKIIAKVAKVNKVEVPKSLAIVTETKNDSIKSSIVTLISRRKLVIRILIILLAWFVSSMGYYGLTLNSGRIGGNIYVNYTVSVVMELELLVSSKFGKSLPLMVFGISMVIAGTLSLLLPETLNTNLPDYCRGSGKSSKVVKRWVAESKRGRQNLKDDTVLEGPVTVATPEMINKVHDIVMTHLLNVFTYKPVPMVCRMSNRSTPSPAVQVQVREYLESIFTSPEVSVLSLESKCRRFCEFYSSLTPEEKLPFLKELSQSYGVNQENVVQVSQTVVQAKERGEAILLKVEERLRNALIPQYQQLFSKIGRIEGGVKFLVDLRADVLTLSQGCVCEKEVARLRALQLSIRDLLTLWFSVGFLQLQRITWESPCDMVQKISEYEAVHPIRNWTDLKRRVGPYRRCFVFTHNSMPREPVVVLHTALTQEISNNIHSIIKSPSFTPTKQEVTSTTGDPESGGVEMEDPENISCAIFYSITSTQKGLQGVDLGNYLIKTVVKELQSEFPSIDQFSSLSPIPGFKDWLVLELNRSQHTTSGELHSKKVLLDSEIDLIRETIKPETSDITDAFKKLIQTNGWIQSEHVCNVLEKPLMRLCARYLYQEKRRGYALNPVANFHLGNGAVLWRLNWRADMTMRGISQSCGIMVNYRYFLNNTEENSRRYLENQHISASQQIEDCLVSR